MNSTYTYKYASTIRYDISDYVSVALYDLPSGNAIYILIAKGKTVLAKPERNFIELYQLLITRQCHVLHLFPCLNCLAEWQWSIHKNRPGPLWGKLLYYYYQPLKVLKLLKISFSLSTFMCGICQTAQPLLRLQLIHEQSK